MKQLIVIDPGHGPGNKNQGPTGYFEHSGMWALSNYLKAALEARGCTVKLTRAENEDPSLTARGMTAKGADFFISEHTNAANGQARGVETYYSVSRPGDKGLAAALSKAVSGLMGNPDRGAKVRPGTKDKDEDYYTVMASAKRAGCPYVLLIENGFHDNPADEAFLKNDVNLKAIAETQAGVIAGFLGITGNLVAENLTPITGQAVATIEQMAARLRKANPAAPQAAFDLIPLYLAEGAAEGIRGDVAFAQACLETGNFTFAGSVVKIEQNNFCGMGVTSTGMKGNSFDTPRAGVRAHIQHLKAYANTEPLRSMGNPIDPRFGLVKRGAAPYVEWLGQKENPAGAGWATGEGYGAKILKILKEMLDMPLDPIAKTETTSKDNPSAWAAEAWTWGIKHGITDGSNPQGVPTREQVVQMIRNYYKMQTGY